MIERFQSAECERWDLGAFHCGGYAVLEELQPSRCFVFSGRGHQAMTDSCIRTDPRRRQVRICAVPEAGRALLPARPALEALAVACAPVDEAGRPRKITRVAPDSGEAPVGPRDKVFEVARPAAVVIREEEQLVGAWK